MDTAAANAEGAMELNTSAGVVATEDLSEYAGGEVLVGYTDGTFEVLACEDENALSAGLEALAANESVSLVQPNYSYNSSVYSTLDALTAQQWALYNDGTFYMEEQKNQFPVYDDPFDIPSAPGQWTQPDNWGMPGGGQHGFFRGRAYTAMSAAGQATAVAGIDINAEEAWSVYGGGQ